MEFLQVPLLVVIMGLTYSDAGRISQRHHEFFEDAFNTLWSKHDARKEGYERPRYTALDRQKFLQLLCAFSASSYFSQDFQMRQSQFEEHLNFAIDSTDIKVRHEDFKKDLMISTSLLIEDGSYFNFIHRSFVEYFTALFIAGLSDDHAREAIEHISDRYETDNVLDLLLSIQSSQIEQVWVFPKLESALEKIEKVGDNIKRYSKEFLGRQAMAFDVIRMLYDFEPKHSEIRAAVAIAKDFNVVTISGLSKLSTDALGDSGANLIAEDLDNFESLHSEMSKRLLKRKKTISSILKMRH